VILNETTREHQQDDEASLGEVHRSLSLHFGLSRIVPALHDTRKLTAPAHSCVVTISIDSAGAGTGGSNGAATIRSSTAGNEAPGAGKSEDP